MRILFLLTQSLSDPSGLGRYWPLARQMARLGYPVEIAALHPAFDRLKEKVFFRDGVKVSYVAQMHVRLDGNRRLYFNPGQLMLVAASAAIALARAALASRADVIHIAKAQPMNGLAGWLGARLRKRPMYLDCDDDETASNRFAGEWQRSMVRWWEQRLPVEAKRVTVNTSYLRDRCIRNGISEERIVLVPNGFDPERFKAPAAEQVDSIRQRWGLSDKQVVLYLGSVSFTNHPILLLLEAFEQVRQNNPSAKLLIVGGGEDYDRLAGELKKRGLEKAAVMTGRVDPDEVASFYAASQIVVDPVLDDDAGRARSPLKIVESLAMGVPVVTGNTGDRALTLEGGRAGVLVKPGSAEALADGLLNLMKDQTQYKRMRAEARIVSKKFRWDQLAREFVKVYSE